MFLFYLALCFHGRLVYPYRLVLRIVLPSFIGHLLDTKKVILSLSKRKKQNSYESQKYAENYLMYKLLT
jgi:hypothetical protein